MLISFYHKTVINGEECQLLTRLLVEYGATINVEDNTGRSPNDALQAFMLRRARSLGAKNEEHQKLQSLLEYLWSSNGRSSKLIAFFS